MTFNRRRFLAAASAASASALAAGCGFAPAGSQSSGDAKSITFTTWGTDAELAGFRTAITAFQQANPGSTVALNAVPYEQMFTDIDAQLQAGNPPDIFRVPYYTFGSYAARGQLLDLSSRVAGGFGDRFTPQAWAAVQNGGKPFGVPHHTDTSVILYNKAMMTSAGIGSVPTSLNDAWTWDEFGQVASKLRAALPAAKYPFGYNWQGNGVTRWLSLLFQADGRFLNSALSAPAIDSQAGREAIDFSKGFFSQKFVPANSSVKASTYVADSWSAQTTAMVFSGAFAVPDAASNLKFDWGATYAPVKVRHGGDFGGNALVATAKAKNPDLAVKFLDFITGSDPMKAFCESASLLPTRRDLISGGLSFKVRPELTKIFLGQAGTVRASDSAQVASPSMSAIITVLKDQLDKAFVGGQSTDATVQGLSSGITQALQR